MGAHRLDGLAIGAVGAAMQAQHQRHAGAVDVGVEHADLRAIGRQRQREVDRHGRLAYPALAGADRDDVAHVRQRRQLFLDGVARNAGGEHQAGKRQACVARQPLCLGSQPRLQPGAGKTQDQFNGDASLGLGHPDAGARSAKRDVQRRQGQGGKLVLHRFVHWIPLRLWRELLPLCSILRAGDRRWP